jgi:hypothetical protein
VYSKVEKDAYQLRNGNSAGDDENGEDFGMINNDDDMWLRCLLVLWQWGFALETTGIDMPIDVACLLVGSASSFSSLRIRETSRCPLCYETANCHEISGRSVFWG